MYLHHHLLGHDCQSLAQPKVFGRRGLRSWPRSSRCKSHQQLPGCSSPKRPLTAAESKASKQQPARCAAIKSQAAAAAAAAADGDPPKRKRGRPRKVQGQPVSETTVDNSRSTHAAIRTAHPAQQSSHKQDDWPDESTATGTGNTSKALPLGAAASQQAPQRSTSHTQAPSEAAAVEPAQRRRRGRPLTKASDDLAQPAEDCLNTAGPASAGPSKQHTTRLPQNASHQSQTDIASSASPQTANIAAGHGVDDQQEGTSISLNDKSRSHPGSHDFSAQVDAHSQHSNQPHEDLAPARLQDVDMPVSSSSSSTQQVNEEEDPWASLNGEPPQVTATVHGDPSGMSLPDTGDRSNHAGRAQPPGGIRLMDLSNLVPSRRIKGVLQTAERSWAATQAQARASLPQAQLPAFQGSTSSEPSGMGSPDEATALTGMAVTWLGTSSGNPTIHRNVSCAVLRLPYSAFLVDCGEGTAKQILRAGLDAARIKAVMITHLHGDHIFGLAGVLKLISDHRAATAAASADSAAASKPLIIVGPPGLHMLLETVLLGTGLRLSMPIIGAQYVLEPSQAHPPEVKDSAGMVTFHWLPPCTPPLARSEEPHRQQHGQQRRSHAFGSPHEVPLVPGLTWRFPLADGVYATSAQLQHRLPCWGYVLQETLPANGHTDTAPEGMHAGRKIVLLGDTCGSEAIAGAAMNADLVSHEATFADGMEQKADIAQHSTAAMAGAFARRIVARQLVLTHFSGRYVMAGGGRGRRGEAEQEEDTEDGGRTINMLQHQASRTFRNRNISAAHDLLTLPVPFASALEPPLPRQASTAQAAIV
ncbi:hypothetical protein WJX74_002985 [Apatococcus lobatus]|uniref:Metallo-beta-lactamase domain-containing protein n=1 Tax=Apatococcus lobatus TaxID=904363 RepID=A0AAW1RJ04_9CHLO